MRRTELKTQKKEAASPPIADRVDDTVLNDLLSVLHAEEYSAKSDDVVFVGPGTSAIRPIYAALKQWRTSAWAIDPLASDSSEFGVTSASFVDTEEWPTFQLVVLCVPPSDIAACVEKAMPMIRPTQGKIVALTVGDTPDLGEHADRLDLAYSDVGFAVWSAPDQNPNH